MQFKNNIRELSDIYDYFIFDVWGVIHDGSSAYSGAKEAIELLRNKGKKICFLSNAPRRAFKVAEVLAKYGITANLYDFILTSGEATYLDFEKNQNNNFADFGPNYFYIGPKKDIDLLSGLNYKWLKTQLWPISRLQLDLIMIHQLWKKKCRNYYKQKNSICL